MSGSSRGSCLLDWEAENLAFSKGWNCCGWKSLLCSRGEWHSPVLPVLLQFSPGVINLGSIVWNLCGRAGRGSEPSWSWDLGAKGWDLGAGTASGTTQVWWGSDNSPWVYSRAREISRSFWSAPNPPELGLSVGLNLSVAALATCHHFSFRLALQTHSCKLMLANLWDRITFFFCLFCCFWMPVFCAEKKSWAETWLN